VRSVTVGAVLPAAATGGMTIESARGVSIRRELGAKVCVNGRRPGPAINRVSSMETGASTIPMAVAWAISKAAVGYAMAVAAITMITATSVQRLL
jgi:hypothetical protein